MTDLSVRECRTGKEITPALTVFSLVGPIREDIRINRLVLYQREHVGDENGTTTTYLALFDIDQQQATRMRMTRHRKQTRIRMT